MCLHLNLVSVETSLTRSSAKVIPIWLRFFVSIGAESKSDFFVWASHTPLIAPLLDIFLVLFWVDIFALLFVIQPKKKTVSLNEFTFFSSRIYLPRWLAFSSLYDLIVSYFLKQRVSLFKSKVFKHFKCKLYEEKPTMNRSLKTRINFLICNVAEKFGQQSVPRNQVSFQHAAAWPLSISFSLRALCFSLRGLDMNMHK